MRHSNPAGRNRQSVQLSSLDDLQVRTIADLQERGYISPQYIEAWEKRWKSEQGESDVTRDTGNRIPLLPLQQEVFSNDEAFRWPGKNLLVTGPTSGGKTFIAEALMASVVSQIRLKSQKCIYAVPLRALADEKYETLRKIFGSDITAASSADHREHDEQILRGEKRIIVVVYEKLYLWLARPARYRNLLENTALLVVDELHLVGNPERGAKLEMILTWARDYQSRNPAPYDESRSDLRIVGISSSKEAVKRMEPWLDAVPIYCDPTKRPVPLIEGIVTLDDSFYISETDKSHKTKADVVRTDLQKIAEETARINNALSKQHATDEIQFRKDDIHTTPIWDNFISVCVNHYVVQGKKVMVYRASKGSAERIALMLAEKLPPHNGNWQGVAQELDDLEDTHARELLKQIIPKGVGFHHGDMTPEERKLVESRFDAKSSAFSLRVVVATPTLSMGINLPADVVVMANPTMFHVGNLDSRKVLSVPLSVLEYKNFAGRAGRYKWDDPDRYGICILLGENRAEMEHILKPLITDPPEEIVSTLKKPLGGIEPYVLATVGWLEGGGNIRVERQQLETLFNRTYAATLDYKLQTLVQEKLEILTKKTDSEGRPLKPLISQAYSLLPNAGSLALPGSVSVAAGAVMSMRTYYLLMSLQAQLGELLKTPLALLYELAATDEASRLYPAATDWSRRGLTIKTIRNLELFYTKLRTDEVAIGEAARIFLEETRGSIDNYTLEYLIRAAAAWSWREGESAPGLAKKEAFPGVRWGHLSDLGDNFSALVETLGRIWHEENGRHVTPEESRHMLNQVRLLSLQLRHGVPAGVEEVASLKVKGWHRLNLLRLWKECPWKHPLDILQYEPDTLPGGLGKNFSLLQQRIKLQTRWNQDPRTVSERQEVTAKYYLAHRSHQIDSYWPEWIHESYQKKEIALEQVLFNMLKAEPLNLDCIQFDVRRVRGGARVDLVIYTTQDRSECICVEVKTSERGVSWDDASQVMRKIGPPGCHVVGRVAIASPGYDNNVRSTFDAYQNPLILFTLEAFVQACLIVLEEPQKKKQFIDLLIGKKGIYERAEDVDRELSPRDIPDDVFVD